MTDRTLGFDFEPEADQGPPSLRVSVLLEEIEAVARSAYLRDMATTIPWQTVSSATRTFAAMEGETFPGTVAIEGRDVVLEIPHAAASEAWRVAVLLNLIDFALGEADRDLRLVDRVTLRAAAAVGGRVAFRALAEKMEEARKIMTERLPPGIRLDQYSEGTWPSEPDEYRFAISLEFSRAFAPQEREVIAETLQDLENMVAWMAFATEGTPDEWIESGRMIFSGETTVAANSLSWTAEFPPSDIALPLLMLERILKRRHGIAPKSRHIEITPRR